MAVELITESVTNDQEWAACGALAAAVRGRLWLRRWLVCQVFHKHENLNSDLQHSCDS